MVHCVVVEEMNII